MVKSEKYVVTAALPYANGSIHLGHMLEAIQADIYTRFLRLQGKDVLYICADDMHGTPVEVNAQKAGVAPLKFAEGFWKEHQEDFSKYLISFDNYYKTHSPENKELAELFFKTFKKKGYIYTKEIDTIYCPHCKRYLPDRFVQGTCPHCTTAGQYGDICESCGSTLKGVELVNPKCTLCGKNPKEEKSTHYFFALKKCKTFLKKWLKNQQDEVRKQLDHWVENLDDWCISRDKPYFGFPIPGSKEETGSKKYFYVWADAPIGYISSTENYCKKNKCSWEAYWKFGQIQHFIGKDIIYFHYLFWPAMLNLMGINLPKITTHGFVTVNGEKMSKSRGTFLLARDFLKTYTAEALRFYYASHLTTKLVDVDLNLEEFKAVNNNVLMANLGNFCYRVLTFAHKNYSSVEKVADNADLNKKVDVLIELIEKAYLEQEFGQVVKHILQIADLGNAYFQQSEVWKKVDTPKSKAAVGWCVNLAKTLAIVVQPILPEFSEKIGKCLDMEVSWNNLGEWKGKVGKVAKLVDKIEDVAEVALFPLDLRCGKIVSVKDHPDADSLYLMQVDVGGRRQVVAGLKKYLSIDALKGKKAVFCVNMKPAKIRGEKSEAMILAADDGDAVSPLYLRKTKVGEAVMFKGLENARKQVTFDEFLKLVITVKDKKVIYDGLELSSPVEDVEVSIADGSRVR